MNISIHALREEGDRSSTTKAPTGTISIHALREEGDLHSPAAMVLDRTISIHALREEGDGKESSSPQPSTDFYPRPPRGGRPPKIKNPPMLQTISIHALREEGDQSFQFAMQTVK